MSAWMEGVESAFIVVISSLDDGKMDAYLFGRKDTAFLLHTFLYSFVLFFFLFAALHFEYRYSVTF